jgi:hypothetical protein
MPGIWRLAIAMHHHATALVTRSPSNAQIDFTSHGYVYKVLINYHALVQGFEQIRRVCQTNHELIYSHDGTEQFAEPISLVAHCWLHADAVVGVCGAPLVTRFPN